jgi:hypothetical protein
VINFELQKIITMKTRYFHFYPVVFIVMLFHLYSADILSGQGVREASSGAVIPANVNAIFQHSCTPCHWAGGGFKSTFHVNFSKWTDYNPDKQVQKAKKICSVLSGDDMPPASAREKRPDIIPTKEQIDAICKWSESLKVDQKN